MKRALLLLAACAASTAFAGRPLSTEDASVLGDKRCQVEAWVDRGHEFTQGWFVPACNFGAGIEWQAGFGRLREEGSSRSNESYAQAKAVLFAPEGSPWAAGVVAGVTRRPLEARRGWRNPYLLVPVSWAPEDGPLLVHANVGWARDANASRDVTLWGAAAEAPVDERFTVVAEAFSENREKPWLRVGGRYTVVKDALDVDLTVVARSGGTRDERYLSLGFTWQTAPFLP